MEIAIDGNSDSCCVPSSDCCGTSSEILISPFESSKAVGYDSEKLNDIPESAILGVGGGNPTRFSDISEGDTVVDLGAGAGIDVFLVANIVKERGKVIGIDMTENMLNKTREIMRKNMDIKMSSLDKEISNKKYPLRINLIDSRSVNILYKVES